MAPEVERKLAAILSADVVGSSRLIAEDEAATIHTLTAYREQVATLVREHRGRVVDSTGCWPSSPQLWTPYRLRSRSNG